MKGLLIKDIRCLRELKFGLLIILIVSGPYIMSYTSPGMLVSYLSVFFCLASPIGIQYDMYENGAAYLFTLPFTRKEYVREKYIFTFSCALSGWLLALLLDASLCLANHVQNEMDSLWFAAVSALVISCVLLSVLLPCYLKFPGEKARVVFIIFLACMTAFLAVFIMLVQRSTVYVDWIFEISWDQVMPRILPLLLGIVAAFAGISYRISVRILEKKDF